MKRIISFLVSALFCAVSFAQSPVIGISSGYGKGSVSVGTTYTDAVAKAGGIPVVIPLVKDSLMAEAILSKVDGLIMTGGEDVDPRFYGEEAIPELGTVNGPRDTSDVLLIQTALRRRIPLLGICRGEQAINVVMGGTLWQDLPSQYLNVLTHRQSDPATTPTQEIVVYRESRLHEILGVDNLAVNSFHHQAVNGIAPGLTVVARTPDGVVEAYEGFPQYDVLGVQFHPEAFARMGEHPYLRIFEDLVSRASKR